MTTYHIDQFTWHEDNQALSADLSDLGLPKFPGRIKIQQSHTPGDIVTYDSININRNQDGDINYVTYYPVEKRTNRHVLLFND